METEKKGEKWERERDGRDGWMDGICIKKYMVWDIEGGL